MLKTGKQKTYFVSFSAIPVFVMVMRRMDDMLAWTDGENA